MGKATTIELGGREYELVLTTRAMRELSERFGGMERVGDRISGDLSLQDFVWIVTLLANQGAARHNLANAANPIPLLTEEQVELLTCPSDLAEIGPKLVEVLRRDTNRIVQSKN